jgi:serine/threonine protein kinase
MLVSVVAVASISLAGCSAGADSGSDTPIAVSPSSSPSANILDSSIEATLARGTAVLRIAIDSMDSQVTGMGGISLGNNRGEITWVDQGSNDSWTDLIDSKGTYTLVEGSWFLAPEGTQTPTSGNISPLSDIGSLTSQNEDALTGTLPLTIDSGMNFSDEELVELAKICDMNLEVEISLDSKGLIQFINKSFNCPGNERLSVTELSDLGSPIDLSTPEDVFEVDPNQ